MRKISLVCILFAIASCLVGCTGQKQFEISLKEGLFQGISDLDPGLTISVELSEMDRVEYVKTHKNKVKDLSTIQSSIRHITSILF